MQSGLYKLRSVNWLLTFPHENGKICPKIYFYPFLFIFVFFLSCFHVLCPSLPQGNQVNGPEYWGNGVWTESCCLVSQFALLDLRCAGAGVETCQLWLLLTLWTVSPGIQIKRILIKECQSDFSHFDGDCWAEQDFACYSAPFAFLSLCVPVSRRKTFPSKGDPSRNFHLLSPQ